jgi:hypothetical protein
MPIDPMIARGGRPLDVSNTLYRIATLEREDERSARADNYQNALITRMNRTDMRARMDRDEKAREAAELEEVQMLYPLVKAGDPAAIETSIKRIEESNPEAAASVRANPKVQEAYLGSALAHGPSAWPDH